MSLLHEIFMKCLFREFGGSKKWRNLICVNNECCEHKMTRKLSDSHYVHNQERMSLLPLKRLQITFFYFSDECSL